MELRQLEYFVAIVENGSFTGAAKQLYVSQSALSKSIKKLEEELDTPLFFQAGQRTVVTDAGGLLYEKGRRLLAEAAYTRDLVSSDLKNRRGRVRIATSCKLSLLDRVSDLLARFVKANPQIFIDVNEASPEYIKDSVVRRNIEVGIIVEPEVSAHPGLDAVPLLRGDYRVVMRKDNPLAQREYVRYADLKKEHWILYRSTFDLARMVQAGCETAGFSPKVVLTASQPEFMLSLVSQGFGITVQAWPLGAPETLGSPWDNIVALPIADIQSRFCVKLVTPKDAYISPATRTLMDFVSANPL